MKTDEKTGEAIILVERLMKSSPDRGLIFCAMQIRDRLKLPMWEVLEKVPGATVVQKSGKIGISRQAENRGFFGSPASDLSEI